MFCCQTAETEYAQIWTPPLGVECTTKYVSITIELRIQRMSEWRNATLALSNLWHSLQTAFQACRSGHRGNSSAWSFQLKNVGVEGAVTISISLPSFHLVSASTPRDFRKCCLRPSLNLATSHAECYIFIIFIYEASRFAMLSALFEVFYLIFCVLAAICCCHVLALKLRNFNTIKKTPMDKSLKLSLSALLPFENISAGSTLSQEPSLFTSQNNWKR